MLANEVMPHQRSDVCIRPLFTKSVMYMYYDTVKLCKESSTHMYSYIYKHSLPIKLKRSYSGVLLLNL